MEYTFSTQMLGTLLFFVAIVLQLYLGYKKKKNSFYKSAGILLFLGFVFTYIWNPVKLDSPRMSDIEYQEQEQIIVPEKVTVETQTLEQKQNKLEKKVEEK